MSIGERVYRLCVRGVRAGAPLLVRGDSKVARGVRGRRGAAERLIEWGRDARDPERPTAWFHAPSVGEGLQARAVMEALAGRRPGVQLAFTHFSPSAESFAAEIPAGVAGYLPWDLPDEVGPVLDALRPALLAFTKTEVWPALSAEATRREVPLVLVAATLPPGAGRLRWPARRFLRPAFRRLERVCAISVEDGDRFGRLGVPRERVVVTGDPGIDSSARRVAESDPDAPYLRPLREVRRPTVVAGSTWPPDEEVLLPAVTRLRRRFPELRLVVAPHEPTEVHLRPLADALRSEDWSVVWLSAMEEKGSVEGFDAVIVDRVGPLAHLYTAGDVAWVGGGFGDDGLHSVLEPAAAGLPVVFGPGHDNTRAAGDLLERRAAAVVDSVEAASSALQRWLADEGARRDAGGRARSYIAEHRGAAEHTARVLAGVMEGGK